MTAIRAAAVVCDPTDDLDAALAAAVAALETDGMRVGGLLQRFGAPVAPGKREMLLTMLPGGDTIRLDDARGPGVQGCTLDGNALARAAMALQAAARSRPDLLVVGRFGKQEAAGGGWRAELAEALLDGIPLMIGVRRARLPAWHAFIGKPGTVLRPCVPELLTWARSAGRYAAPVETWAAASTAR